ncbi:hypothetical protein COHA_010146 [Chlorella ohadii]|uniref:DNA 3'-5' helicase n=1 Tax=Chlorella ohadii TaxID=2649997 RepID=A0AAD5DGN6_9CHLO|nr:hypothetical protein COHA_010146 [Chlorella ohadii]
MLPAPPAPPAQQAQQAQQAEQAQQEAEVDAMLAALEEDGLWRGVQYVARDDLKALRSWISEQKALGRTPACFHEGWQRGACELFQSELKRLCKVDFNDMIAETNDLLRRGGEVADKLRRCYTHVFVDEFQDCSPPQIELALLLGGPAARVTAVGDAAQPIFGFSAATPHAFNIFATAVRQLYGLKASRLALTLNYRSTASVLKVGNELLGTATDEAVGIADRIQALVQEGVALDEIAVLFRCFNWGGTTYLRLQAELEARGIPYRRLRAKKVLEDRAVQVLLAWLRLLLDPSDDSSFLVAMAEPKRGLGEAVEAALLEHQAHQQLVTGQTPSLESCALDLSAGAGPAARQLSSTQREALASLLSLLRRLRGEMQQQRVQAANEGSDDEGEEEDAPAADEAPEEGDQEAAGEAAVGGGEEEEHQQGVARDIFKVYRHRCRAGGPLGALQREAAAFPLGAWQAGDRAAQDGSGIDACGGPSLQRIAYHTLFAHGSGCEAELLEHLLSQEESRAGSSGSGGGSAKGREWDVVFSPRWYEGFMPSSLFDNQHLGVMPEPLHQATIGGVPVPQEGGAAEHRAEARRLAHVAATRARRRHFISYPCKMVSKRGWPYEVQPSSFLEGVLERYRDTPTLELELAN